jgi:hypothetical protein
MIKVRQLAERLAKAEEEIAKKEEVVGSCS